MSVRPFMKALVVVSMLLLVASSAFSQEHAATVAAGGFTKPFAVGMACFGVAIGVGLVGFAAASGVSRNPGAFGNILIISILAMAIVEAIAFYAIFFPY